MTRTTAPEEGASPDRERRRRRLLSDDPAARRRRDRALAVAFVLLALVLVVRAARKSEGVLRDNQDFGAQFLARADPYYSPRIDEPIHAPYPPSFALVAVPLSLLPTTAARVLWAGLQVGALVATYFLLRRRTRLVFPELAPHAPVLYAAALLLASRYVLRDTSGGGGNLVFATLALLGLELALSGRPGRAGLPLGLGLVLKPNLAPLLLFFALKGRWRVLASTAATALVLFWLPAPLYGVSAYASLASGWAERVTAYAARTDLHRSDLVPEGMPPARNAMNQGLREAVHRVFRPPGDSGAADVHVVELSPRAASGVALLLSAGLLLVAASTVRRARGPRAEWLAALALLPLCMLLSPIAWKAHHAALLPFFYVLVCTAASPISAGRPRWLVPVLVAYWFACGLLSEEVVGKSGKHVLQALSVVTWATVGLVAVAAILVRRASAAADAPPPPIGGPDRGSTPAAPRGIL